MRQDNSIEDYLLHADFKQAGDTVLPLVSPTGEKERIDLHIERTTYEITKRSSEEESK